MNQPAWVRNYRKEPQVKDQLTLIGQGRISPRSPSTSITAPIQRDLVEFHQGEEVINKPTVDKLGGNNAVRSIINNALAKPNIIKMQRGGTVPERKMGLWPRDPGTIDPAELTPPKETMGLMGRMGGLLTGRVAGGPTPSRAPTTPALPETTGALIAGQPLTTPQITRPTPTMPGALPVRAEKPSVGAIATTGAPIRVEAPPPPEMTELVGRIGERITEKITPPEVPPEYGELIGRFGERIREKIVEPPEERPELSAEERYKGFTDESIRRMQDISRLESPVFQKIANIAFTQLDPRLQTEATTLAMQLAQNPYMSEGARRTAMADQLRSMGVTQGNLAAELAKKSMDMVYQATSRTFDMAQRAKEFGVGSEQWEKAHQLATDQFELSKEKFDYGKQTDALDAVIEAGGNWPEAERMFKDVYGVEVDFSNMASDDIRNNYNAAVKNLRVAFDDLGVNSADEALDPTNTEIFTHLDTMWENTPEARKEGVDRNEWNKNMVEKMLYASSSFGRITMGLGGDEAIMKIYPGVNEDNIDQFKADMLLLDAGGGMKWDAEENAFTVDNKNPLWGKIGGYTETAPLTEPEEADVRFQWNQRGNKEGEVDVMADGKAYKEEGGVIRLATADEALNQIYAGAETGDMQEFDGVEYVKQEDDTWQKKGTRADKVTADIANLMDKYDISGDHWGKEAEKLLETGDDETKDIIYKNRANDIINNKNYKQLTKLDVNDPVFTQVEEDTESFSNAGEMRDVAGNYQATFKRNLPQEGSLIKYNGLLYIVDETGNEYDTGATNAEYSYIKIRNIKTNKVYYIKPELVNNEHLNNYFFLEDKLSAKLGKQSVKEKGIEIDKY